MTFMSTKELKWSKLLAKSALVSVLAFSVGTSSALASDSETTSTSTSITQEASTFPQAVTTSTESETETPDLLPGDFFYFIKTIYENIQMALTVNDVKEARLLVGFAQERLAEANSLLAEGKIEEAKLSLQKSLETQQNAVEKTDEASGTSTQNATETTSVTTSAIANSAELDSEESDDPEQSEAEDETAPDDEVKNPDVLKVKTDLQHNIIALASALEKVKNPRAQLALLKNIEKSFAHLDKKLSKIESKAELEQTDEDLTDVEVQDPVEVAVPVSATMTAPVTNEIIASVQVEQESSVAKVHNMKMGKDRPDTDKSHKVKKEKNNNHHNGGGKDRR